MKKIVLQKENGETIELDYSELFENNGRNDGIHLCWENCANATPRRCKKIYDLPKQTIDNYDFITDGFQIVNGDQRKVDRFIVTGCNHYEEEPEREKMSVEERKRINDIRRNMAMLYYEADTIEEAEEIQRQQIEKGLQKPPKKHCRYL